MTVTTTTNIFRYYVMYLKLSTPILNVLIFNTHKLSTLFMIFAKFIFLYLYLYATKQINIFARTRTESCSNVYNMYIVDKQI